MDDNLLTDSDTDTLLKMFDEVKRILPCWELQFIPEKYTKRRFFE